MIIHSIKNEKSQNYLYPFWIFLYQHSAMLTQPFTPMHVELVKMSPHYSIIEIHEEANPKSNSIIHPVHHSFKVRLMQVSGNLREIDWEHTRTRLVWNKVIPSLIYIRRSKSRSTSEARQPRNSYWWLVRKGKSVPNKYPLKCLEVCLYP